MFGNTPSSARQGGSGVSGRDVSRTGRERLWAPSLMEPVPPAALAVLSLATAREVNGEPLTALIRSDDSFTVELLRVANSALCGFSRRVDSVAQAVVLLGLNRVKAMAVYVALGAPMRTALMFEPLKHVWSHTNATAMISERLAERNRLRGEEAYTAGLLHNLGVLGIMCVYPADYALLLETPRSDPEQLLEAERSLFGTNHCEAGARLAREWGFPDTIAIVANSHHTEPVRGERTPLNMVRVALRVAEHLGFGVSPGAPSGLHFEDLLAHAGCADFESAADLKQTIESQLEFLPGG